jgi:transposase
MGSITLSEKEQKRVLWCERVVLCKSTVREAAACIGLSDRQMRRLVSGYRVSGMSSLVHGNRGRTPANKTDTDVTRRLIELMYVGGQLYDMNVCHLQGVLSRDHGIFVRRSTLDRLLHQEGLRKRSRKQAPLHRQRRERLTSEGSMLQIDGSPHDWLESRGPRMCLMGAIDDATSKVVHLNFRPTEDQAGYLMMLRDIVTTYGVPAMIYHDKHTILRSPKKATFEDELAGINPMSQVQRVMDWIGVEAIAAGSPQAKGRIERLWGTLQDRLVKEMRLAGICTLEDANRFLPSYIVSHNARFAIDAACPDAAWVPVKEIDADYYFASREQRTVRNDNTVPWLGKTLQILPDEKLPYLIGKHIWVHTNPEGKIVLYLDRLRVRHELVISKQSRPKLEVRSQRPEMGEGQDDREQVARRYAGTA